MFYINLGRRGGGRYNPWSYEGRYSEGQGSLCAILYLSMKRRGKYSLMGIAYHQWSYQDSQNLACFDDLNRDMSGRLAIEQSISLSASTTFSSWEAVKAPQLGRYYRTRMLKKRWCGTSIWFYFEAFPLVYGFIVFILIFSGLK